MNITLLAKQRAFKSDLPAWSFSASSSNDAWVHDYGTCTHDRRESQDGFSVQYGGFYEEQSFQYEPHDHNISQNASDTAVYPHNRLLHDTTEHPQFQTHWSDVGQGQQ